MRFASLGSGSEGNALLVETRDGASVTRVLVDCGFGQRECARRLARLGLAPADLDAILVTHEHGDHVAGVIPLARRHRLPVHMTLGTSRACAADTLEPGALRVIDAHAHFDFMGLRIQPVPVPHDAREPVQYVLDDGRHRLGVLTDLGHATALLPRVLIGLDALVLETNHDLDLLAGSAYPASLKRRIAGDYGHLCNDDAARLLQAIPRERMQVVVAAHLSRQNNRADLARRALADAIGADQDDIRVADQDVGLDWVTLA